MIVPMMKYSFVLYHMEHENFLERLQGLGLVDITISDWVPSVEQRQLVQTIDRYQAAYNTLKALHDEKINEIHKVKPFSDAVETFERYTKISAELENIDAQILRVESEIAMLEPWGTFDVNQIVRLRNRGVVLRFFSCYAKEFETNKNGWSEKYALEIISEVAGVIYFVIVQDSESDVIDISAQELRSPDADANVRKSELVRLKSDRAREFADLMRCAKGYQSLKPMEERLKTELQFDKVLDSGAREAEGTLIVLEGWATKDTEKKVDEFLASDDSTIYYKERPTPDDNPPVLLKNNKFSKLFEVIGNLYSLPNYHAMDLTPYFAPFFMIFFGFCLGDAGYGLLFVIAALIIRFKVEPDKRGIPDLVIWCGLSTVVFGMLTGTFFGVELAKVPALVRFKDMFVNQNDMFAVALYVGVFQILYAMGVKTYGRIRRYGFVYGLSTMGWMLIIVSTALALGYPVKIEGYTTQSVLFIVLLVIGFGAMLLLNEPKKSLPMNFGLGLWDLYNAITGFLGDMLSYIRLFALGLCSGIIASVFNSLAVGLSPDIPVIGIIVTILILIVGHSINIFMSTLGSFVHPLRLTFVEFYKNAGFEDGGRAFDPLKKNE